MKPTAAPASLLLLAAAVGVESEPLAVAAVGGYALGAPILHLGHGSPVRAAGSLALRVGLPLVLGGGYYAATEDCRPDPKFSDEYTGCAGDRLKGATILGGIGVAAAVLIDATVLAYERVPVAAHRYPSVGVGVSRERVSMVVSGTF